MIPEETGRSWERELEEEDGIDQGVGRDLFNTGHQRIVCRTTLHFDHFDGARCLAGAMVVVVVTPGSSS